MCGHIHQPANRIVKTEDGEVTYLNSGDWWRLTLEYNKSGGSAEEVAARENTEDEIMARAQDLFQELLVEFNIDRRLRLSGHRNGHHTRAIEFLPLLKGMAEVDVWVSGVRWTAHTMWRYRRFQGVGFSRAQGGIDWGIAPCLKPRTGA